MPSHGASAEKVLLQVLCASADERHLFVCERLRNLSRADSACELLGERSEAGLKVAHMVASVLVAVNVLQLPTAGCAFRAADAGIPGAYVAAAAALKVAPTFALNVEKHAGSSATVSVDCNADEDNGATIGAVLQVDFIASDVETGAAIACVSALSISALTSAETSSISAARCVARLGAGGIDICSGLFTEASCGVARVGGASGIGPFAMLKSWTLVGDVSLVVLELVGSIRPRPFLPFLPARPPARGRGLAPPLRWRRLRLKTTSMAAKRTAAMPPARTIVLSELSAAIRDWPRARGGACGGNDGDGGGEGGEGGEGGKGRSPEAKSPKASAAASMAGRFPSTIL